MYAITDLNRLKYYPGLFMDKRTKMDKYSPCQNLEQAHSQHKIRMATFHTTVYSLSLTPALMLPYFTLHAIHKYH